MSTSWQEQSKVGLRGLQAAALLMVSLAMAAASGRLVPAAQAQAPAPEFSLENNALKLPSPIVFELDSDKLSPQSDAALNHIKAYLEAKSYITLMRIEGWVENDQTQFRLSFDLHRFHIDLAELPDRILMAVARGEAMDLVRDLTLPRPRRRSEDEDDDDADAPKASDKPRR